MNDLNSTIKILCIQNRITVTELEKELGFGKGTINKWSYSSPSVNNLLKVARRFNITVSDIIGDNKQIVNI